MRIRAEQMRALEHEALRHFENEMVAHAKSFSPRLCEVLDREQLRVVIRSTMYRADRYGFTNRGPIRIFIELTFLCGSAFDTDPQYPDLGVALRSWDDQMARAEQMHRSYGEYLENVAGPENANTCKALEDLSVFAQEPITWAPADLELGLLQGIKRISPQRAAYIGNGGLKALISEGIAEAQTYGFTAVRPIVLIVILMFAFGHGCTKDPLYPWIALTLQDPRITNHVARAERLEKKARTWLNHVLAGYDQGRRT